MASLLVGLRLLVAAYIAQTGLSGIFLPASVDRRLLVCFAQIVLSGILLLQRAQLQDRLTASEVACLHDYPVCALLSITSTGLGATVGMVRGRLRRAMFLLLLVVYSVVAYHLCGLVPLLFVETMGIFSCFGVLCKTAIVVGSVFVFAPMCVNILVCFLAVFFGVNA